MPLLFIQPGTPNPITVILGLVFLAILGHALWETVRLKRFGDPVLDLSRAPVPLGGTVEGRISLGPSLRTAPDFKIKLQCLRRVLQQGGKNSHWVETILWCAEDTATLLPGGIVPISMPVPPDQQATNSRDAFDQIVWRLTVRAPFRGPSFWEKYEIPVEGRTAAARATAEEETRLGQPSSAGKVSFTYVLPFFIVGLAVLAGGLYLLPYGVRDVAEAGASSSWPSVPGRVLTSTPPRGSALFVSRSDLDFAYTYEVGGHTYTGHTIFPHVVWRRTDALQMAKSYPKGMTVRVSYSPENPALSLLVPGLRAGAFQRLIAAAMVLGFGTLLVAVAVFAPRDGVQQGNTVTFKKGTTGSRVMGYSFLFLLVAGVGLWWIT